MSRNLELARLRVCASTESVGRAQRNKETKKQTSKETKKQRNKDKQTNTDKEAKKQREITSQWAGLALTSLALDIALWESLHCWEECLNY